MSLLANIDHLAAAKGIVALCVNAPNTAHQFRGADNWHSVLEGSIRLLDLTGESTIRLVIGKHTMVVQREGGETVAVVLPTGHAIAKSLRRMIRRMSKKDRGPLVARPASPTHHSPAQAQPTSSGAAQSPVVQSQPAQSLPASPQVQTPRLDSPGQDRFGG